MILSVGICMIIEGLFLFILVKNIYYGESEIARSYEYSQKKRLGAYLTIFDDNER